MRDALFESLFSEKARPLAIILGTNEIASATAVRLAWERYLVILSHDPFPPVIRRGMAFYDALFGDRACVDGIAGERAETIVEIADAIGKPGCVAVTPLQLTDILPLRAPDVLIDARMQKHRVTPDLRGLSRLTIGYGPRFEVGRNCDIAVETHPKMTGRLIEDGCSEPADGAPRQLGRAGKERFVYSDCRGSWRTPVDVGMQVFKGFEIGRLAGEIVQAPIDGFLRGIVRDGCLVPEGVKLLEIDPRGREAAWTGTDERGRAIAEAAMKAIRVRSTVRKTLQEAFR
jgi:hypothetical protein